MRRAPSATLRTSSAGPLRGVGSDYTKVGDVVALFEGGDAVNVEDDRGDGSTGLGDEFAGVVGDDAELHARGDVSAALDEGIPDAGAVGEDINEFFNPDGIFDGMRIAGKHLEGAHGAESAVDEESEVVGFAGSSVPGFDDTRRFAAHGSGVIQIPRGAGVGGAFAPDDDVIGAGGEDHLLGGAVL